jgi:Protein of unknown function (DUF2946)
MRANSKKVFMKPSLFVKRVMLCCALLAMAFKAFIPAGFMLAPAQHDQLIAVVICTGDGTQTFFMDKQGQIHQDRQSAQGEQKDKGHDKDHEGSKNDHPCAFAGQGGFALAQMVPLQSQASIAYVPEAPSVKIADQAPGRGLAAPPPPATASPILI